MLEEAARYLIEAVRNARANTFKVVEAVTAELGRLASDLVSERVNVIRLTKELASSRAPSTLSSADSAELERLRMHHIHRVQAQYRAKMATFHDESLVVAEQIAHLLSDLSPRLRVEPSSVEMQAAANLETLISKVQADVKEKVRLERERDRMLKQLLDHSTPRSPVPPARHLRGSRAILEFLATLGLSLDEKTVRNRIGTDGFPIKRFGVGRPWESDTDSIAQWFNTQKESIETLGLIISREQRKHLQRATRRRRDLQGAPVTDASDDVEVKVPRRKLVGPSEPRRGKHRESPEKSD